MTLWHLFINRVNQVKISDTIDTIGTITKNDVAALLGVSPSTAIRTIKKMIEQNLLKQEGKAKNTRYTLF